MEDFAGEVRETYHVLVFSAMFSTLFHYNIFGEYFLTPKYMLCVCTFNLRHTLKPLCSLIHSDAL